MYKKWHELPSLDEIKAAIDAYNDEKEFWFKVEPFILHIAAQNLEAVEEMARVCKKAGLKRFGIQPIKHGRYLIELQGTTRLEFPLSVCPSPNWNTLIKKTHALMKKNWQRMERFKNTVVSYFKKQGKVRR